MRITIRQNSAKSRNPIFKVKTQPRAKICPFFHGLDFDIGKRSFRERVSSSIFSLRRSSTKTTQILAIRPKWITMAADIATAIVLKTLAVISLLSKNANCAQLLVYYYQQSNTFSIDWLNSAKKFSFRQNTDLFIDTRRTGGKADTKRGLEDDQD